MQTIKVVAAIRQEAIPKYREAIETEPKFETTWVNSYDALRQALTDSEKRGDVLVVDATLGDAHDLIEELRQRYTKMLIILVDEDADFALPGRADEISTAPFKDNELIKLMKRVYEDRRLVTLRADALPPVRIFAKKIMNAQKAPAKIQAAVETIQEIGFDYVAFYSLQMTDPPMISLTHQVGGDEQLRRLSPQKQDYNDSLVGVVAQTGQTRVVGKDDTPNHPFISRGKFTTGVCAAVGSTIRFGVILAGINDLDNKEKVLMLELVASQLGSALAREARG
jgi:hypothetical protein